LSASQVLGLASQTAGLLLRQTLETISAPPNSLGAIGPSSQRRALSPAEPGGAFSLASCPRPWGRLYAASDCLRDDSVVASRVAFAVPCTPFTILCPSSFVLSPSSRACLLTNSLCN